MRLRTLGGVVLEGSNFTRIKPLLLLSFLAVEGSKDRRYLSEFFWPGASDGLNSLSRALSQLRKDAPGAIDADEQRVWTAVPCDTQEFLEALDSKNIEKSVTLYQGAFLDGAYLQDWGEELEEWVYAKRELFASYAQEALLSLAEDDAARGRFAEAARRAEAAFTLSGAPIPEPENFPRYYALLVAGNSSLAVKLKEEADGYGISLKIKSEEAKGRLQVAFVGREKEKAKLEKLAKGQWAWVSGSPGIGKTSLLRGLSGTYLPARSGLPYATLEPLLGSTIEDGEELMLRKLSKLEGVWLLDPWEWMDQESQKILRRLRDVRPASKVIIASREKAPFRVDTELELASLSKQDLQRYPEAWEKTEGLPALVGAFLRGEPLEEALETRLKALPKHCEEVYLALSLLENPDPALVRRALGLKANAMAHAFEALLQAGLVAASGKAHAPQAAKELLESHSLSTSQLAIKLARELDGLEAYPLYSLSKLLWEDDDLPKVQQAYLAWANELLRRGFPQRASETLSDAPKGDEITLLRGRALERSGLFKEALKELEGLKETSEVLALKGALYWRLGKPEEAKIASESALSGDMEARAEALNTLGHLARSEGNYKDAESFARRAAALWRSLGNQARLTSALNSLGIAKAMAGEKAESAFQEALEVAGENLAERAVVMLNIGMVYERNQDVKIASESYKEAAQLSEVAGSILTAANAWNNLGVLYHKSQNTDYANQAYQKALDLSQKAGEHVMLGMIMANLAELNGDVEAWKEALRILEEAGHKEEADQYRTDLPLNHPFRNQEIHLNGS
jgi:tetratricopeptide (TPR) repeat protein